MRREKMTQTITKDNALAVLKDKINYDNWINAAMRCEQEGTRNSALNAKITAAYAAYAYAAYAATADAYAATAYAATADAYATYAAAADAYATYAAAADAATAYAAAAAATVYGDKRDEVLTLAAEICVEACILCKTQGSAFLEITNN
jgi:hypothetical protein